MERKTAIFAGGCFWCVEDAFQSFGEKNSIPELIDIESGYTGGDESTANYQDHKYGNHREAVRVTYDPNKTTFKELVEYFFTKHDPTDSEGSFYDRGFSYSPAIYYENESERADILSVIDGVRESGKFDKPIVTAVEARKPFYPAEDYHQKYSQKNPEHYNQYSTASGRKEFTNKFEGLFS